MNDIPHSPPNDLRSASQSKARTWPHGVPALRLNRRTAIPAALAANADLSAPSLGTPPPRLLRLRRLLLGVLLLALAWLCLVLVASLGMSAWASIPHQKLSPHLLLYVLEAIGACWVGLAALGCIITGAFCLALALTTTKW
ncbi:MAG: hypothetical protein ACRDHP_20890 [Ktedonobacterales bacterium]